MSTKIRRAWVQVPSVVGHRRGMPIQLQFEDGSPSQGKVLKVDAIRKRLQVELVELTGAV